MINFELLWKKAKSRGIQAIELVEENVETLSFSLFDNNLDKQKNSIQDVIYVRGIYNNKSSVIGIENNSDKSIPFIIDRIIDNCKSITNTDVVELYKGDKDYDDVIVKDFDFDKIPTIDKINLLKNIHKEVISLTQNLENLDNRYFETTVSKKIKNSLGLNLSTSRKFSYVLSIIVLKKDNEIKEHYKIKTLEEFSKFDYKVFSKKLVDEASSKFNSIVLNTNNYVCILKNNVVADLLSSYKSIFYAQSVIDKTSFLQDKLDSLVFGKNISIIDNNNHELSYSNTPFTDEGVKTKSKTIVENGELKTYLYNLKSSKKLNSSDYSNGFSVGGKILTDFVNLELKCGNISYEDAMKNEKNCVIITNVDALHSGINVISGDFNLPCSGYLVEEGKIKSSINLVILSGNFKDMLNSVKYICNDVDVFDNVICPSIVVSTLKISGN